MGPLPDDGLGMGAARVFFAVLMGGGAGAEADGGSRAARNVVGTEWRVLFSFRRRRGRSIVYDDLPKAAFLARSKVEAIRRLRPVRLCTMRLEG